MAEHRRLPALPAVGSRARLIAGGILALLVIMYVALILMSGGDVRQGSVVRGVTIGGLSSAEAVASLDATLGKVSTKPFKLEAAGKEFVVKPKDAGLEFDATATVQSASGRSWNPLALAADEYVHWAQNPDERIYLGFPDIDGQMRGIAPSEMCLINGYSHSGKTLFLLQILLANKDKPVIYFCPDEPRTLTLIKLACLTHGIDANIL